MGIECGNKNNRKINVCPDVVVAQGIVHRTKDQEETHWEQYLEYLVSIYLSLIVLSPLNWSLLEGLFY